MKPTLTCIKKTVITVNADDLSNFLFEVYALPENCDFELAANMEWSNYESHEYNVAKEEFGSWEQGKMKRWYEYVETGKEEPSFILRTLLVDLANKDIIEEGHYVIKVDW
jgi:hypothetical protein